MYMRRVRLSHRMLASDRPRSRRLHAGLTFHDQRDFVWEEHAAACLGSGGGAIVPTNVSASSQLHTWERHHRAHAAAPVPFFRERRYLLRQFPVLSTPGLRLLECGCGNGSSVVPVLRGNDTATAHATDVSGEAVALTRRMADRFGVADRLTTALADADDPAAEATELFDAALLIFTASAVPAAGDLSLLRGLAATLRPGGTVCFRDYGLWDLRHRNDLLASVTPSSGHEGKRDCARLSESSFLRAGGAFRRYYSLEDVSELARAAGLVVSESRYCCVRLLNKKRALTMDRVYVHAVLSKPD